MNKRFLPGLMLALLALLVIPAYAQIEIDPDDLPAWDKVTLTQRDAFDIPDFGELTVYYPDGWAVGQSESGFGNVNVANSEELLEEIDSADGPQPGQLAGVFFGVTEDQLESLDIADEPTVGTLLTAMLNDLFLSDDDSIRFNAPQSIELSDQRAVVASGTRVSDGEIPVDLVAFASEPDGKLVFSLFVMSQEDIDQFAIAEMFAVVASMRVDAGETGAGGTDGTRDVEIELFDTITASDPDIGTLTLAYPEGYVARDAGDGSIYLADSQATMDIIDSDDAAEIEADQFGMVAIGFPADFAIFFGINEGDSLEDALLGMVDSMFDFGGDMSMELNEPEALDFGANSGAIVTGTATEDGVTNDGAFVLVETDGGYVLLIGLTAEGAIGNYDAVIRAVAASVEYAPPEE